MDSSDFSILIGRLEREADELPQLHVAKVACVAALGYAWPALLAILTIIALFVFLGSLLFGEQPSAMALLGCLAGAAALLATMRALWVRMEEPDGMQIAPEDAPELFALVAAAGKLNGVSLDTVRINDQFGLAIRQVARWSVFGGSRNHLQLGAQLLSVLSVDEFVALLAHEVGHLRSRDHWFSAWIYRQRVVWNALLSRFQQPANAFDRALAPFYGRYIPYFAAYAFALARKHEYAADHVAAAVTDPQVLGEALIKTELAGRFLSEIFWPSLFAQVAKAPDAPRRPYTLMQRAFQAGHKTWTRQEWLNQALNRYPAEGDTHPSLVERLAALEVPATTPAYDPQSAALSLLGDGASGLIAQLDEHWHVAHAAKWRARHREIQETRWKLDEYERCDPGSLGPEDLWAKAHLLLNVNRAGDAIETLHILTGRQGAQGKAHMLLGELLLARGEERGLEHLIAAAGQDGALTAAAGELGYSYLVHRGRKHEAMRFWRQLSAPADA